MREKTSRHTQVDMDKCTEAVGGRHDLILLAARRARYFQTEVDTYPSERAPIDALLEIQDGLVSKDYRSGPIGFDENEE